MSRKPICYMSPEDALHFVMTRAQRPDPLRDNRDGIEDRLPQGARVDGPLFQEGTRHRAPNGRPLQDLQLRQGIRRPAPGGPPGVGKRRGSGQAGHADEAGRWLQAQQRKREKAKRHAMAKLVAKLEKVTPAALRKREQRAKAKLAKLAQKAAQ